MISSTAQHRLGSDAEAVPVSYTSIVLKLFVETFQNRPHVRVLDLGPVCQENMTFFALLLGRYYVCDMFVRLNRRRRKEPPRGDVWSDLDYQPSYFDGIQLWDFCDHLDDGQVTKLVERCYTILRPAGLLMLIAFEKPPASPLINTYIVDHDYRLEVRPKHHLEFPWNCRHNRALTTLWASFTIVKSFRYRSGLREFLFTKPGHSWD